jgi:serine/threonine-protein kinase
VYLAEDTWIDKKVALKVPHKQGLDFSELLKEPRLLASMSHPNIVTVLTAEKTDDLFFIVMEYVQGETLEEKILRDGALDVALALDLSCQICNAVDHAHRAGILHRDLRPGNMLVSGTGLLKVTDFGTSRFLEIAVHGRRSSAARRTWLPNSSTARRCWRATSTRSASRCTRCSRAPCRTPRRRRPISSA